MAILKADDLLAHATRLIDPAHGSAQNADLRRAISACYYGVFHSVLTAAADQFVGEAMRGHPRYNLVYRSLDHARLRDLCNELKRATPSSRYGPYLPPAGIGASIVTFATITTELLELRHTADYDPGRAFTSADTQSVIRMARTAIDRFNDAEASRRGLFLTLLFFPPRR